MILSNSPSIVGNINKCTTNTATDTKQTNDRLSKHYHWNIGKAGKTTFIWYLQKESFEKFQTFYTSFLTLEKKTYILYTVNGSLDNITLTRPKSEKTPPPPPKRTQSREVNLFRAELTITASRDQIVWDVQSKPVTGHCQYSPVACRLAWSGCNIRGRESES